MNKTPPSAALLIIGNEILSGRTQDKNTAWIGEHLAAIGIPLSEVRVVPDIENRIISAINELRRTYTYVFTTGGIGPTHDDITAESIAKAFKVIYETNDEAFALLNDFYTAENFTPARQKMAKMPRGVELIPNPVSIAPGFIIENVYIMAGVPNIMQAMMDYILPTLERGAPILSKTLICNRPESAIAETLTNVQMEFPDIDIGSYPRYEQGSFRVSVVLRGTDEDRLNACYTVLEEQIVQLG